MLIKKELSQSCDMIILQRILYITKLLLYNRLEVELDMKVKHRLSGVMNMGSFLSSRPQQPGDTSVNHCGTELQPNVLSTGHVTPDLFLKHQKG